MSSIRDFAKLITDLRAGRAHQEISEAVREATEAATQTGKKSSVTLKLTFKPKGQQFSVADDIKKQIPRPDQPETVMFFDENYNLTRCDIRQMELGDTLRQLDEKKGELVNIDKSTGELKEVSIK